MVHGFDVVHYAVQVLLDSVTFLYIKGLYVNLRDGGPGDRWSG